MQNKIKINFGTKEDPIIKNINLDTQLINKLSYPRLDCYPRYDKDKHSIIDCCVTNKMFRLDNKYKHLKYLIKHEAVIHKDKITDPFEDFRRLGLFRI